MKFEQLNTMRTLSGYKSVNEFLNDLIRAHKITKMNGEIETLRERMKAVADVDVEHLVDRLKIYHHLGSDTMMEWRPKGYMFDTNNLIRALFDQNTSEGTITRRC